MRRRHDMPFGASLTGDGTQFRLWAPAAKSVDLCLIGRTPNTMPMIAEPDGWFAATVSHDLTGCRYVYVIDGGESVPDPASRSQPEGPMRPSEVVDPASYDWRDSEWQGRPWHEAVLYELHIGTFTEAGTFQAAIDKLDHIAALGVTALEIMPVAEFVNHRNWGYDGVDLFAAASPYGGPSAFKALIDAAHARGLMVILDVVWNHFGPEGNYLPRYAPAFFTDAHRTPWGGAVNFDQRQSGPVREFYRHNALYWLTEFNLDGLRLDAIHTIKDDSDPTILTEISNAVREHVPGRPRYLIVENELNGSRPLERDGGGIPKLFTAQWNDDFHHPLHVLITGEHDAYYVDYADRPIELLGRALAEGFGYQGEASILRHGAPRGEQSAFLPPLAFIPFLQNHDQIGNRPFGERLVSIASPEALRAAVAILLLCPQIPILFMGEEWGSEKPFPYFCEASPDLGEIIRRSRAAEFAIGARFADKTLIERIPNPMAVETFESAKLDWEAIKSPPHSEWLALYRQLLAIRAAKIVPLLPQMKGNSGRYQIAQDSLLTVDWATTGGTDLTLIANLCDAARTVSPPEDQDVIYESHPGDPPRALRGWSVRWMRRDKNP